MFVTARLLEAYVRSVRLGMGAESCSLFVPSVPGGLETPVLIHEGDGSPLPELATLMSAYELHRTAAESPAAVRDSSGLLLLRSASSEGWLVGMPPLEALLEGGPRAPNHRRNQDADAPHAAGSPPGWLGLRGSDLGIDESRGLHTRPARSILIGLGAALSWLTQQLSSVLDDPVTGLPERTVLQAALSQALHRASSEKRSAALLLVSPRNLTSINERFGRSVGDAVLREIARRLSAFFRSSDLVSRYGAGVFAVVLFDMTVEAASKLARRLVQEIGQDRYAKDAGDLLPSFAVGVAGTEDGGESVEHPFELLRRADLALAASREDDTRELFVWSPDLPDKVESSDKLSGIFTANVTRDYRNMVLLWDTIGAVATHSEFSKLVGDVTGRLFKSLRPDELGLFLFSDENELVLFRGLIASPHAEGTPMEADELSLGAEQRELLEAACRRQRPASASNTLRDGKAWRAHAFPLAAHGRAMGCLYLAGDAATLELDALNVSFLGALAGQLAQAMERARARDREEQELRSELKELRRVVGDGKLISVSAEMRFVLRQIQRIAPSDATVLLIGESGTGKELLARMIHDSSSRSHGPLVVLDCGAVAPSLLEAELFGHERGAFTGAHERRLGRLAEASGGTILLDEIGELPVDLQAKLLRFVQEKQLVPVGGSRPQTVDVRILAATHRDLRAEAEAGRFRADLYYRLNVIRIDVPPLRERPDDVLLLANHFLKVFALRYDRPLLGLTRAAEQALVGHGWPGNVRELQNRMMKAVLLADGERIDAAELELGGEGEGPSDDRPFPPLPTEGRPAAPRPVQRDRDRGGDGWDRLRSVVREQVAASLARNGDTLSPIAAWLENDFVHEALDVSDGVLSRAAVLLGVPESTLRRKSRKAPESAERPGSWRDVRETVRALLGRPQDRAENLLLRARGLVLEVAAGWSPPLPSAAQAAVMGVTPHTLRRWIKSLRREGSEKTAPLSDGVHHF